MTTIRNFDPQENRNKFSKKYTVMIAIFLFTLIVVEIWASNTAASFGEKFASISKLKQSLLIENQILENEIAQKASLSSVASESAKLGFFKIGSIQYIR